MKFIFNIIKFFMKMFLYLTAFVIFPFELVIWIICLMFGIKLYKKGKKCTSYNGFLIWLLFKNDNN